MSALTRDEVIHGYHQVGFPLTDEQIEWLIESWDREGFWDWVYFTLDVRIAEWSARRQYARNRRSQKR